METFLTYLKILKTHFWILQPWEVIRAAHASLKVQSFTGNFLWCQFTGIWYPACWLWLWVNATFFLPWIEVFNLWWLTWVLNPLDDLCHGYKIDIIVIGKNFIDPIEECLEEFRVIFKPCSVEVETEWSAVLVVVTLKIVLEKSVKLIT